MHVLQSAFQLSSISADRMCQCPLLVIAAVRKIPFQVEEKMTTITRSACSKYY